MQEKPDQQQHDADNNHGDLRLEPPELAGLWVFPAARV
jgi:hypothetical protein